MLLKDKVCIIAGAGSPRGIGYAAMQIFASHGATVIGCDLVMDGIRRAELIDGLKSSAGLDAQVDFMACDITKAADCDAMLHDVLGRYGRMDGLVNCAGIVESRGMLDIDDDSLDRMLGVNLKGAFTLSQSVLRQFVQQGHGTIVHVASVAAQRGGGLVGGSHYAASKGGMISMTRSIAREFGPHGVRANVVCPSMTQTSMLDGTVNDEQHARIVSDIPLRRAGQPQDVAGACLFLTSDLSAYITGATIDVNGGSHIH